MTSSRTCSSVQKMWASSWVMWRTRMQPVQRAARLVAVDEALLGVADRQVAVGAALVLEELDVAPGSSSA